MSCVNRRVSEEREEELGLEISATGNGWVGSVSRWFVDSGIKPSLNTGTASS